MPVPDKSELLGMQMKQLEEFVSAQGEPRFRADQLYKWIYVKTESSFYKMSDLPKATREKLDRIAKISIPKCLKQRLSADGGTRKLLLELEDKKRIEAVLIPQTYKKDQRYSLCVSTQVGCPVNCAFCATGKIGFHRHLKAYEIIGQVLAAKREIVRKFKYPPEENIISSIVYMGMGEPLLNYDAVLASVRLINDHKGINIGQRHITISTSGVVPGIEKLAREELQVTLAISLHAADNNTRDALVPINKKYPLEVLWPAVEKYIESTGRRVTLEYVLLDGVNMSREDADRLIKLTKPLLANINLIAYNEVNNLPFKTPASQNVNRFMHYLAAQGLSVTLRDSHGEDIAAACGQLAAQA